MDRRRLLFATALLAAAPGLMAAAPKEDKKKGGGLAYLQINPLTATVARANGRRGILMVEAGLDIPDSKLRATADTVMPRLRAALVQVLQIYAAGLPPEVLPNPDILGQLLQREADRVLGRAGAKLLLGTILVN